MISKRDVQLGKIALKQGMVNKEQLTKCLALKKKLAKNGKKVQLGSLLIKKGYIDKSQLEEIVRLHNEKVSRTGDEESKTSARRSQRRSKRTSKTVEAVAGEAAEPEKKAKKKKKRTSARAPAEDEDAEAETATATRKPRTSKTSARAGSKSSTRTSARTSKRAKTSREARSKSKKAKAVASDIGSEVESAVDTVDPALFQSAHDSDVETSKRRLIGCPECGKKYRVRAKQVGKRFSCRRCEYRIKVPRDLFQRTAEKAGGVEVEEFLLSSSEQIESDEAVDAVAAARAATKAVEKIGKKTSIRELAKAAEGWQAKPAGPKKKFGLKGLATMGVSFGIVVLLVGGVTISLQAKQERLAQEKRDQIDKELKGWEANLVAALAKTKAAEQTGNPHAIGGALGELQIAREAKNTLLQGNNRTRAIEYETTQNLDAQIRDLFLTKGRLVLEQGGLRAGEAVRDFEDAAKLDPTHEETQCLLADMRIRARDFGKAAEGLKELVATSARARALQGLAWELGDAGDKAATAYEALDAPGSAVLVGRAQLVDRQWGRAMDAVRKSDLSGAHLAAAKIVEALAYEGKKEFRQALATFDKAVLEGKDLPYPYLARGAFRLRQGKDITGALKDIKAGNRQGGTAWGYYLQGEAHLAMLELRNARDSFTEAVQAKPLEGAPKVADVVDPFAPPLAPDYKVLAHCRLAFAFAAEGQLQAARVEISRAIQDNPFSPYAQAALTHIDLLQPEPSLSPETETLFRRALERSRRVGGEEADTIRSVSSGYLLLVYGALLVNRTRYGDAVKALTLSAQLDPSQAPAAKALQGEASRRNSLARDASEAYSAAARLDGRSSAYRSALRLLANPKTPGERLDEAVQSILLANPYSGHGYVLKSRVLLRKEKPKEALKALERALLLNPELGLAYTRRALLFVRDLPEAMHDVTQAGKDVDKAMAVEVKQAGGVRPLTYIARALYHVKSGESKNAIAVLDQCLKTHSKYTEAFKLRAKLHVEEGNKAKARADWKRYKELTK